jgi:hypothetical protein
MKNLSFKSAKSVASLAAAFAMIAIFAGCALLSPYSITFTTPDEGVVDPTNDTIDLVINLPALAYVSYVQCGEDKPMELLPVVTEEMKVKEVHNLSLGLLAEVPAETLCEIGVTAFDKTTTANSQKKVSVYVLAKPAEILAEEEEEAEKATELVEEGEVSEEATEEATDDETETVEDTTEDPEFCDDGTVCPLPGAEDSSEPNEFNNITDAESAETGNTAED